MVPTSVTYTLEDIVNEWIKHSVDGYGPQHSDPDTDWYLARKSGDGLEVVSKDDYEIVRWREREE